MSWRDGLTTQEREGVVRKIDMYINQNCNRLTLPAQGVQNMALKMENDALVAAVSRETYLQMISSKLQELTTLLKNRAAAGWTPGQPAPQQSSPPQQPALPQQQQQQQPSQSTISSQAGLPRFTGNISGQTVQQMQQNMAAMSQLHQHSASAQQVRPLSGTLQNSASSSLSRSTPVINTGGAAPSTAAINQGHKRQTQIRPPPAALAVAPPASVDLSACKIELVNNRRMITIPGSTPLSVLDLAERERVFLFQKLESIKPMLTKSIAVLNELQRSKRDTKQSVGVQKILRFRTLLEYQLEFAKQNIFFLSGSTIMKLEPQLDTIIKGIQKEFDVRIEVKSAPSVATSQSGSLSITPQQVGSPATSHVETSAAPDATSEKSSRNLQSPIENAVDRGSRRFLEFLQEAMAPTEPASNIFMPYYQEPVEDFELNGSDSDWLNWTVSGGEVDYTPSEQECQALISEMMEKRHNFGLC